MDNNQANISNNNDLLILTLKNEIQRLNNELEIVNKKCKEYIQHHQNYNISKRLKLEY
jgi:hypothetical protein